MMVDCAYKYHQPVLLEQAIEGLNIKPDGVYVDATFGGGGHSKEILRRLNDKGKLYGFDQDKEASKNIINDHRFVFIGENFKYLKRFLKFYGALKVDGILGDLGVSSHQFDSAERGFSLRFDSSLDMRMNVDKKINAQTIINEYEQEKLTYTLFYYGDLKNSKNIARSIVSQREKERIETTGQLKRILQKFTSKHRENKFFAQVFQAIRIEVNQELDVLESLLKQSSEALCTGGRLSIISYHSLEDRIVKRFIKNGKFKGPPEKDLYGNLSVPFKSVSRKVITPTIEEIRNNNRSRSAKLRIAEKI